MQRVQLIALVFTAVALLAGVILVSVYQAAREKAEREKDDQILQVSPIRRFITPVNLFTVRFLSCFGLAAAGMSILVFRGFVSPWLIVPAGCALGYFGWKIPMFWFGMKIRQRKEAFDSQILNLTMSLSNGLRSGQALPQALEAAARQISNPMREELAVVIRETRLGLTLPEALDRLHRRMPGEDLRLLLTSVKLTLQTGGSLADVLGRMVEMIRSRTEFQEKVKTMTAQGRFEAIAMSLAPLFVYILLRLIDPPLMKPLTSTVMGWCTIIGVTILVSIGFFIINKIVTIEV